jgi:dipeptidyl aminopeptidase/acylaminoacyl peptidase
MSDLPQVLDEQRLWSLARVSTPTISRAGDCVVFPVRTTDATTAKNQTVLYKLTLGAQPVALTVSHTPSSSPALSPDAKLLAFLRKPLNAESGEEPQLHLLNLADGGEARVLTDFPLGVREAKWFADGKRLCLLANVLADAPSLDGTKKLLQERAKDRTVVHCTENKIARYWDHWMTEGEVQHLFELSLEDGNVRDLTPSLQAWFDLDGADGQFDIAPDGESLAFSAYVHQGEHRHLRYDIYVLSLRDDVIRCISAGQKGDAIRPRFSPDATTLVYGARRDTFYSANVVLWQHTLSDRNERALTAEWDRSPDEWEFASTTELIGAVAHLGRTLPFRLDLANPTALPVLVELGGTVHGVRAAIDGTLYFTHDTLSRPAEIACLRPKARSLEYLTHFNDSAMRELQLGAVHERYITGAHGDRVQYWLLEPAQGAHASNGLVHVIHGGPFGNFGDTWHWRWNAQLFAARGYHVAMVNFHGSNSFGESFAKSVLGDWGGAPAQDIGLVTDALIDEGVARADRVAIAGGSYGGYMASWLVTQTQRYACAVAHAPVTSLRGMFASDVTQGWDEEVGAWPWDLPDGAQKFVRFDPMHHVGNVQTPVLVIHGQKDYRVPYAQGLEFYGALKARGVTARLLVFPQENHWILQRDNSVRWFREIFAWLDRFLRKS